MATRLTNRIRAFFIGLGLGVAGFTLAATTFPYFQPATGILKGSASTYVTTAAAASDVTSMWTGTCDGTTYLRGDGSCAMPSGTGAPASATYITQTPDGGLSSEQALSALSTGILKSTTGTGVVSIAAASDIISLWTGTCTASTEYLAADGSCQTVSAGASGADPTATIGATAVNGVATTFMRSDAAPALPATLPALSGVNLTALDASNLGSGTVPSARVAGTYSNALTLSNASNAITAMSVVVGGSNVCRADGTDCPSGSVTETSGSGSGLTVTGCGAGTASYHYTKTGSIVVLTIVDFSCTSSANTFTIQGFPVAIRPAGAGGLGTIAGCRDNNAASGVCSGSMASTGELFLRINNSLSGWTASNTKGIGQNGDAMITYSVLD